MLLLVMVFSFITVTETLRKVSQCGFGGRESGQNGCWGAGQGEVVNGGGTAVSQ